MSTWIGVTQVCLLPLRIKIASVLFGHHIQLLKKRNIVALPSWLLAAFISFRHFSYFMDFFFLFGVSSLLLTPYLPDSAGILVLFLSTFLVCARGVSAVADPFPQDKSE